LFDTGLTVEDVPSYRRASLEAITLFIWDNSTSSRTRQLFEHLKPAAEAEWLFYVGDWEAGARVIGEDKRVRILDRVVNVIPPRIIPSLLAFIARDNPASARAE
jgi:hypothetical protein